MDEIRAVAGPIVQRYFDKVEQERQAAQAAAEAEAAKKREAREAEEAAKQAAQEKEGQNKDEEMTDAPTSAEEGAAEEK